jgi:hypothetical protein
VRRTTTPERCRATLRREPAEGDSSGGGKTDTGESRQARGQARRDARGASDTAEPPKVPERRFVAIDPWSVLLEQLMEVPEEEAVERKGRKGK